ncbi:MAG TPA: Ig-like domain-containing protein [Gemmatimonadaceae bacterium]|nr:Ig-like domain-containing protein [Gemmatimonadaceae bacterium]
MRARIIVASAGALAALVALACGGADRPAGPAEPARQSDATLAHGSVVSPPVSSAGAGAGAAAQDRRSVTSTGYTYVSLVSGTVPDGVDATITNLRTAEARTVHMLSGGFDPQAFSATVGDTMRITVRQVSGDSVLAYVEVNLTTRPRVVRTNPPRGQTDVPVNARITIVFSEPVAPPTVSPTTVTLSDGTASVPATVQLVSGNLFTAELVPNAPLTTSTQYTLDISTGVTGVSGSALDQAVELAFVTTNGVVQPPLLFTAISVAAVQACGLTSSGEAYCWGDNRWGQLGDGTTVERHTPVAVIGGPPLVSISVGNNHTCALDANGAAFCWGENLYGQLGIGSFTNSSVPVRAAAALSFRSITAGDHITCGIALDGDSYCWGLNGPSLGGGSAQACDSGCTTPVRVAGGHRFTVISKPAYAVICGLEAPDVYCWGMGVFGELGTGNVQWDQCDTPQAWSLKSYIDFTKGSACSRTPVRVSSTVSFAAVASLAFGTCGLDTAGALYCWGYNSQGQFGDGTTTIKTTPTPGGTGVLFREFVGGNQSSCGIATTGQSYCWSNLWLQMACPNNASGCNARTPALVPGDLSFTTITNAGNTACGLVAGGQAYCWGLNVRGVLGNNSTVASYTPVAVMRGQ